MLGCQLPAKFSCPKKEFWLGQTPNRCTALKPQFTFSLRVTAKVTAAAAIFAPRFCCFRFRFWHRQLL